ncbi:hypothetical protein D3C72_1987570 [compost metagenome]
MVVRRQIGERGDRIAEEIGEGAFALRARLEGEAGGDDALHAGNGDRRHPDQVAAAMHGGVIVITQFEADIV